MSSKKEIRFNLTDVISTIKDTVVLNDSIVDVITASKSNSNDIKTVIEYLKSSKDFFSNIDSILTGIVNISNNITSLKKLKIDAKTIKSAELVISSIYKFMDNVVEFVKNNKQQNYKNHIKHIEDINKIIDSIFHISEKLIKSSATALLSLIFMPVYIVYMKLMSKFIDVTYNIFSKKGKRNNTKNILTGLKGVNNILDSLFDVSKNIIKLGIIAVIATPLMLICIAYIWLLVNFINIVSLITRSISKKTIVSIYKSIHFINKILTKLIFISLKVIALAIIATLAIPALLIDTIFILALTGFVLILKLLLKIAKVKFKDILSLILLSVLIGILIIVAGMVLLLGVIGSKIKWLGILAVMGGILLVTIFCIAIGFAAGYILPIIGIAAAGLLSILIIVGLLVLISLAMLILQQIEIDVKKIKANVKNVMDASKAAMSALFEPVDKPESEEQDSWVVSLVKGLCEGAVMFIQAILSIRVLALTVVAIALITVIAAMLSQLQKLDLDSKKIEENVKKVMSVTRMIRELLFCNIKSDNESESSGDGNIIKSLINVAGGALDSFLGIIGTILSVPILLYTMVSVGAIWAIAGMLSKLQNLVLDEDKIKENIRVVISTAKTIRSIIMEPQSSEEKEDNSKAGLVQGIIKVVGGVFNAFLGIIGTILSVPILLYTMVSVGIVWLIAGMLTKIVDIQLDESVVIGKIDAIINCAKSISQKLMHRQEESKDTTKNENKSNWEKLKDVGSGIKGAVGGMLQTGLDVVTNIAGAGVLATLLPSILMLGTVTEVIKSVSELQIDEKSTITKVDQIIRISGLVSKQVTSEGAVPSIDRKKVDDFSDYVDSSIKYFNHIDKLDVNKIKSIGDMYEKMGQFMEKLNDAPIDEIADALVNKISPALSDINNNLGGSNQNTNTTQTQGETGTTIINNQQPQNIDYTSMLENIEDLLEQIKKKLNKN